MKAVATFLLVLCHLAISHAWRCQEAPRLNNIKQIDAGQGKVVARDQNYAYFLIGSYWYRLSTIRMQHVSVGPAGLWASSTSSRVYKFVAGNFQQASGLTMRQVDAGGNGQVVGVATSYSTYCLRNTYASAFKGGTSLSWNSLSRSLRYYSCGPLYGCWGIDTSYRVYHTRTIVPSTCGVSSWTLVTGLNVKVIEVGTDGTVFAVTTSGLVYQRTGISSSRPQGTHWIAVSMCMPILHLTYDLGQLWVVTNSGFLLKCSH
ncbi:fish-egg lectin-like [Enoplosus armatus]|uniref:fish-egg lectin-like n=1 Tax=Enoplosus armatus TaxID=215367 RepID=UPI00399550A4